MIELKQLLIDRGIKPTYQRIKILEYLQQNRNHPTVDMIFTALDNKVPTLSKTTVYNTLDVFNKKGLVNILTITGSELRYDIYTKSHHHFLCRKCNKILDIAVECSYFKNKEAYGHKIEEIHGYFKGVCKDCLEKEKN